MMCSNLLPTSSALTLDNPVTLPPGFAKLVTTPLGNWVGNADEDNRYGLGHLLGGEGGECASGGHDHINLECS